MIIKKYHLQLTLPNSYIWHGFINVEAEKIEDFPKIPEGEFFIAKDEEGWHGTFNLTNAGKCNVKYNWVISYWYSYQDNTPCPKFYSTQDATDWMHKYENKIGDESIRVPITKGKLNEPFDMDFFLELLYEVAGNYLQTGFLIGSGMKPNNDNIEALNNLINYVKSTINTKETKNV